MKTKVSEFALCWVVVGPVWTADGPYDWLKARRVKDSYNDRLPAEVSERAKVRMADGTEIDDEGYFVRQEFEGTKNEF